MIPQIIGSRRHGVSVKRLRLGKVAKGAGAVVIGLIALDLIATTVTIAIGATWLHR